MIIELLLVAVAIDVAADVYDVVETEKAFKQVGAIEGNGMISFLARSIRPSAPVLYAINLGFIGAAATAGILTNVYVHSVNAVAGVSGLAGSFLLMDAYLHFSGARKGVALLKK